MTPPKTTVHHPSIWLLVPALIMALAGSLFWWRRQTSSLPEQPPIPAEPPIAPLAPPATVQTRVHQSPFRWILYIGAALLLAGTLIVLQDQQPDFATALFGFLLITALVYGVQRYARQSLVLVKHIYQLVIKQAWQTLLDYADAITFIVLSCAFPAVFWAATTLRAAHDYGPLLGQGIGIWTFAIIAVGISIALKPTSPIFKGWRWSVSPPPSIARVHVGTALIRLASAGLGVIFLFLLAESSGQLFKSSLMQVHHVIQLAFLVLGTLLLVIGIGGRIQFPMLSSREKWLLACILALTFLLRSLALEDIVHRLVDEANFMDAVPRLWAKPTTPILYPFSDLTAFTWVYTIFQSAFANLIGSGLPALRLPSAIFGTLGVAALYYLVRTLFHDKVLAFIAAAILATLPPHIHFSRLGLNNIADPFFGTLSLAFLMRGFQSQRHSDFVIAGALLGLTQYFYEGGRLLFPPLFMVAFIIGWLSVGRPRTAIKHGIYTIGVAILVAAPVYYTLFAYHYPLTPRLTSESYEAGLLDQVLQAGGLGRFGWLNERVANPFLLYITHPDQSWFYGGTESIIILALVPALLLGTASMLSKLRSAGTWLLLVWVGAATIGNMFLRESLWIPRYVVVFPALALIIAIGLWTILRLWLPRTLPVRWIYGLAVALTIIAAAVQTTFYFRDQVPAFMRQFQQKDDWNDAFFRMIDLPEGTRVHFIMDAPPWNINVQAFLGYYRLNMNIDTQMPFEITPARLQTLSAHWSVQHVFFLNPTRHALVKRLQQCFILEEPEFSPFDVPIRSQLALFRATAIRSRDCGFPTEKQLLWKNLTVILP